MPLLTGAERLILSNQYRILEALYPKEAKGIAHTREAIENGFELEYRAATQHVNDGDDIMAAEECREVIDILEMFSVLKRCYKSLPDKSGIDEAATHFEGFDGNNETKQVAYARHFCGDGDRFSDLDRGDNFNSHFPTLEPYRRMVAEWEKSPKKHQLSKEDLIRITSARRMNSK